MIQLERAKSTDAQRVTGMKLWASYEKHEIIQPNATLICKEQQ